MSLISQSEYKSRRETLLAQLTHADIAIIPGAHEILRAGDTPYYFRQQSDFYYLTGFNEPDAILVLIPGYGEGTTLLFNRPRDPVMEIWNGHRAGQEGATKEYGIDVAYPIERFTEILPQLLTNRERVLYPIGGDPALDAQVMAAVSLLRAKVRSGVVTPDTFQHIAPYIHDMRLRKSPAEVETMKKAAIASMEAHKEAMAICTPGRYEYELEAALRFVFYRHGCRDVAYSPIVGSGKNTCILHYTENNQSLCDGDLVLVDAGGEYECYASDITRTYPVNGRFSTEQKAIYELVLRAQMAAIALIKPGLPFVDLQETIRAVLTEGLLDLGLLKGERDKLIASQAVNRFYMHNSGHWLGLDTHDAGTYKINQRSRPLEAGFVLTVEPGLYIPADSEGVDPCWWNIGVRIEDNILVTPEGYYNLTGELIKTVSEIEQWMAR